jgi:hypothetical protein
MLGAAIRRVRDTTLTLARVQCDLSNVLVVLQNADAPVGHRPGFDQDHWVRPMP